MKKNKLINITSSIVFFFVLVFIFVSQINHLNVSKKVSTPKVQPYSDAYLEWEKLSEEEKSNYIEPPMYEVQYFPDNESLGSEVSTIKQFDLRNEITVKVKNQEQTDICWAFGANSSIETNLALQKGQYYDFSERHIDYSTSKTFLDGINPDGHARENGSGGNASIAFSYYTSGRGPIAQTEMPFENNKNKLNLSSIKNKTPLKQVSALRSFPTIKKDGTMKTEDITAIRNMIKEHIMNNGSVTTAILSPNATANYNSSTSAYYYKGTSSLADHLVSIVGWDDDYAVANFKSGNRPSKPGAYIVKNSWGTEFGKNGYYYISYEDYLVETFVDGVVEVEDINYDNIYQHDKLGSGGSVGYSDTVAYGASVFSKSAVKTEVLKEVAFYNWYDVYVDIYINSIDGTLNSNKLELVKSVPTKLNAGYNTIKLDNPVYLTGSKYVVMIKYRTPNSLYPIATVSPNQGVNMSNLTVNYGESYISHNGTDGSWYDLKGENAKVSMKAFTINYVDIESVTLNQSAISINKGRKITLTATINPSTAQNKNLIWKSEDESIAKINTTEDMSAEIIGLELGTAIITVETESGNKIATSEVTVTEPLPAQEMLESIYIIETIEESNYILNISSDTKVQNVKEELGASNYNLKFYTNNDIELLDTNYMGSGSKIVLYNEENEIVDTYIIIIKGDLDGDGQIMPTDLSKMRRHLAGIETLNDVYLKAAILGLDIDVTPTDLSKIRRHLAGIESIK